MMTINNIIKLFSDIASAHKQINSFVYGDVSDLDNFDDLKHPALLVEPIQSVIAENTIIHSFTFYVADLVNKDESNQNEVYSDTQLYLTDIVKVLKYNADEYELINEPILSRFKQKWNDDLSGYQGDFEIEIDFDNNVCDVPIESFLTQSSTCPSVTIYDGDGNIIEYVDAGGSYVCSGGGVCLDANVTNSNSTYSQSVASGSTLTLPDTTYDIYVNGVLNATTTLPTLDNSQNINITA